MVFNYSLPMGVLSIILKSGDVKSKAPDVNVPFFRGGWVEPMVKYEDILIDYSWEPMFNDLASESNRLYTQVSIWIKKRERHSGSDPQLKKLQEEVEVMRSDYKEQLNVLYRLVRGRANRYSKRGFWDVLGEIVTAAFALQNNQDIRTVVRRQNSIHQEQVLTRDLLKKTVERVKKFQEVTLEHEAVDKAGIEWRTRMFELYHCLDQVTAVVYAAAQGQVHELLIGPKALMEADRGLRNKEELKDYRRVLGEKIGLLAAPKSILMGTQGARVVLHVPLAAPEVKEQQLWHLPQAVLVLKDQLVRAQDAKPYYVVDEDGWGQTLTADELDACTKAGRKYLCHQQRIARRGVFDCTSALYHGADADKWCLLSAAEKADDHVEMVGPEAFAGKASQKVDVTCPNRRTSRRWSRHFSHNLPLNCSAEGEDWRILASGDFRSEHYNGRFNLPKINSSMDLQEWDLDQEDLKVLIPEVADLEELSPPNEWKWLAVGAISIVTIGLLVVVAGLGVFFFLKKRRKLIAGGEDLITAAIEDDLHRAKEMPGDFNAHHGLREEKQFMDALRRGDQEEDEDPDTSYATSTGVESSGSEISDLDGSRTNGTGCSSEAHNSSAERRASKRRASEPMEVVCNKSRRSLASEQRLSVADLESQHTAQKEEFVRIQPLVRQRGQALAEGASRQGLAALTHSSQESVEA